MTTTTTTTIAPALCHLIACSYSDAWVTCTQLQYAINEQRWDDARAWLEVSDAAWVCAVVPQSEKLAGSLVFPPHADHHQHQPHGMATTSMHDWHPYNYHGDWPSARYHHNSYHHYCDYPYDYYYDDTVVTTTSTTMRTGHP